MRDRQSERKGEQEMERARDRESEIESERICTFQTKLNNDDARPIFAQQFVEFVTDGVIDRWVRKLIDYV